MLIINACFPTKMLSPSRGRKKTPFALIRKVGDFAEMFGLSIKKSSKKSKIIRLLASERNLVDLVCGGNADAVIIFIVN